MPPLPSPQGCRACTGLPGRHAVLGSSPLCHAAPWVVHPHVRLVLTHSPCHGVHAKRGTAALASEDDVDRTPLPCHAWTARGVWRERWRESLTMIPYARG